MSYTTNYNTSRTRLHSSQTLYGSRLVNGLPARPAPTRPSSARPSTAPTRPYCEPTEPGPPPLVMHSSLTQLAGCYSDIRAPTPDAPTPRSRPPPQAQAPPQATQLQLQLQRTRRAPMRATENLYEEQTVLLPMEPLYGYSEHAPEHYLYSQPVVSQPVRIRPPPVRTATPPPSSAPHNLYAPRDNHLASAGDTPEPSPRSLRREWEVPEQVPEQGGERGRGERIRTQIVHNSRPNTQLIPNISPAPAPAPVPPPAAPAPAPVQVRSRSRLSRLFHRQEAQICLTACPVAQLLPSGLPKCGLAPLTAEEYLGRRRLVATPVAPAPAPAPAPAAAAAAAPSVQASSRRTSLSESSTESTRSVISRHPRPRSRSSPRTRTRHSPRTRTHSRHNSRSHARSSSRDLSSRRRTRDRLPTPTLSPLSSRSSSPLLSVHDLDSDQRSSPVPPIKLPTQTKLQVNKAGFPTARAPQADSILPPPGFSARGDHGPFMHPLPELAPDATPIPSETPSNSSSDLPKVLSPVPEPILAPPVARKKTAAELLAASRAAVGEAPPPPVAAPSFLSQLANAQLKPVQKKIEPKPVVLSPHEILLRDISSGKQRLKSVDLSSRPPETATPDAPAPFDAFLSSIKAGVPSLRSVDVESLQEQRAAALQNSLAEERRRTVFGMLDDVRAAMTGESAIDEDDDSASSW